MLIALLLVIVVLLLLVVNKLYEGAVWRGAKRILTWIIVFTTMAGLVFLAITYESLVRSAWHEMVGPLMGIAITAYLLLVLLHDSAERGSLGAFGFKCGRIVRRMRQRLFRS